MIGGVGLAGSNAGLYNWHPDHYNMSRNRTVFSIDCFKYTYTSHASTTVRQDNNRSSITSRFI